MNKIYKLKFDKRRNELVVVSEITTGTGKEKSTGQSGLPGPSVFRIFQGRLTPLSLLTGLITGLLPFMTPAADLPVGGQILAGQGSITSSGTLMTVHQMTPGMVTSWQSFDIAKNHTVQFIQPDSSSVVLNRVTGGSASQIMGSLNANGRVFLVNPAGVLFGKGARVSTSGLVASTRNLSTADFMQGNYTFSGSGVPGAEVVNQGTLTTSAGGFIVLAADRVSNRGTVSTPAGRTVLASAGTVTLQLDNSGLTSVAVNGAVVNALAENRGLISATDGRVLLTARGKDMLLNTVVNNSGTVEAKGLHSDGGVIRLDGGDGGVVSQTGQLRADSTAGKGGLLTLEGQYIHLADGSLTSATGKTGGGEVYVGGGWQGQDRRIHNASGVVMDKAAVLDASATGTGDGGTAVLWSDGYTGFRGTILATGAGTSGHGGRVETSSHDNLQAFGNVDTSAPGGRGGYWLLDPTDVTIVGTGTSSGVSESGKGTDASLDTDTAHIFSPDATGARILNSSIEAQLNNGTDVLIKTSGTDTAGQQGNITVNAAISKSAGGDATLSLQADRSIQFNQPGTVVSTQGALNLDLQATGNVYLLSDLSLNGGNVTIHGAPDQSGPHVDSWNNGSFAPTLNVGSLTVTLNNVTGNENAGFHFWRTTVNAAHDITISAGSPTQNAAIALEGSAVFNAGGNITLNGNATGTSNTGVNLKNITLNATQGIQVSGYSQKGGTGLQAQNVQVT
ncbi:filamentous hemagglutinin N-terminal domain-containing protein, partial [Salmonella enterica]|nr:filamentous hemagglutinin N-terminal domain-containing protein [Salmonella enterica]